MVKYPILQATASNRQVVVVDFVYKDEIAEAGFVTNGANIPRIFWCIISPFTPKYSNAYVIHDLLCKREEYAKADKYFEELLYSVEINIKTIVMVNVVKAYHTLRYGTKHI